MGSQTGRRSPEDEPIPAGRFVDWLVGFQDVLHGQGSSDVPCDGCTACCRSSQFVHVGPDETAALAHIPAHLLFPAPLMPGGHVVMGYDEHGRCPMLVDDACSIYPFRPRTCRAYDCRVFAAADVEPDPEHLPAIADRVRRWRFEEVDEVDRVLHDAVRAAAAFVRDRGDELPDGTVPSTTTQHALLALELHGAFLGHDGGALAVIEPAPDEVEGLLSLRAGITDPPPDR